MKRNSIDLLDRSVTYNLSASDATLHKVLLSVLGFLPPVVALINQNLQPGYFDPVTGRLFFSLLFIGLLALIHTRERIPKYYHLLLPWLLSGYFSWLAFLLVYNNFHQQQAASAFGIMICTTFMFKDFNVLKYYLSFISILFGFIPLVLWLTTGVPKGLLLVLLPIFNLMWYFLLRDRIGTSQRLSHRETLFQTIFQETHYGIMIIDVETDLIMMCNEQAVYMFQAENEAELLNMPINELYKKKAVRFNLNDMVSGETVKQYLSVETEFVTKKGATFQGSLTFNNICLGDKELIVSLIEDITERKEEEAERQALLTKTAALYRASRTLIGFESLPELLQVVVEAVAEALPADRVSFITFDSESEKVTHFVKGGPGLEQINFIPYQELQNGLSGWVIRAKQAALSPKEGLDPRESPAVQQRRMVTQCGSILVVPLLSRETVIGTITAINRPEQRDFTEQDAELISALASQAVIAIENNHLIQALRQSEERTRLIVETAHDAIVTVDNEGFITGWNAKAKQVFGWSQDEIRGRSFRETIMSPNQPLSIGHKNGHLSSEDPEDPSQSIVEMMVLHCDGKEFPVEMAISPMQWEDDVAYSIFMRDITQRKRATRIMRQAKEAAEAAAQAKTEFLANMSHEIRTPMNAVIGMTSLLLDTSLSAEQHEFVEVIRSSGNALLALINDVLDFSKIEAGKLEIERQPFGLHNCVEEAMDLLTAKAADKGLEMAYFIEPHVPPTVLGDVTRLRQVLVNLLGNAVKFTESGEVIITVAGQEVDEDAYRLHFSVKDSGIGIAQDRMDRLFRSFSQVDTSMTRRYGGTGLGLVISKRLVELMGGTIGVKSEEGVGTTFHFTILVEAIPTPKSRHLLSEQPELRGKRTLIVEEHPINRRLLKRQMEAWQMCARVAESGMDALHLLEQRNPFDIIILDMQLPDMEGVALVQMIRRIIEEPDFPIVVLTPIGWRADDTQQKVDFIQVTKPVKLAILYDTLISIVSDQPYHIGTNHTNTTPTIDPSMAEHHPLRILLAEDNTINQKVALNILGRMGYRVDVAANGLEVLAALQRQPYDVVLMDVQMPEMDGEEATRCIRHPNFGLELQPRIVAMTAHAMQGNRERYLASGMDDYISKPVHIEELVNVLYRCPLITEPIRKITKPLAALPSLTPRPPSPTITAKWPIDMDFIEEMLGPESDELLQEMIPFYFEEADPLLTELQAALSHQDATRMKKAAHTLKGSSASLGITTIAEGCLELETLIHQGDLSQTEQKVSCIKEEYGRIQAALGK